MRTNRERISCIRISCTADGSIVYYSKKNKGYAAVGRVDVDGKSIAEWVDVRELYKRRAADVLTGTIYFFLLYLLPIMLLSSVYFALKTDEFIAQFIFLFLFPFSMLWLSISKAIIKRNARGVQGAVNMIKNAYGELGRVPSIEEAKQFSRFEDTSEDNISFKLFLFYIIMIFNKLLLGNCSLASVIFNFFLLEFLDYTGKINFFQYITTRIPSDEELMAAIKGLKILVMKEA